MVRSRVGADDLVSSRAGVEGGRGGPGPAVGAQPLLVWGMRAVPPHQSAPGFFLTNPSARELELEDRAEPAAAGASASGWRWKVGSVGRAWGQLGQAPPLRPAEDSPVWFCPDHLKTRRSWRRRRGSWNEMLEVVEQRDAPGAPRMSSGCGRRRRTRTWRPPCCPRASACTGHERPPSPGRSVHCPDPPPGPQV